MSKAQRTVPNPAFGDFDRRERLSKLSVLVADRDYRTAALVQRILFSFGFRNLDITTSGESAMALLRSRPYDIIITELTMAPVDGITLIKTIRAAKDDERIRRDIPILMLTARTDVKTVSMARDAGVTEFVAKPFSAKTISNRIIQIIDNPRAFVESPVYVGPDRRRKGLPPAGTGERRNSKTKTQPVPSDNRLQKRIGASASEIMDATAVTTAQQELLKASIWGIIINLGEGHLRLQLEQHRKIAMLVSGVEGMHGALGTTRTRRDHRTVGVDFFGKAAVARFNFAQAGATRIALGECGGNSDHMGPHIAMRGPMLEIRQPLSGGAHGIIVGLGKRAQLLFQLEHAARFALELVEGGIDPHAPIGRDLARCTVFKRRIARVGLFVQGHHCPTICSLLCKNTYKI
jgi:two-component system, chemotaxis family, chemotaxis protein CheY